MSEPERDREVDAAWRAANREEPSPALDTAIRAEARRAVGASPAAARRRRRKQLRYPFAAAATVALLAFGIAQMVPPDQDAMIVAEQATPRQAPAPREAPAREPTDAAPPPTREQTTEAARAPEPTADSKVALPPPAPAAPEPRAKKVTPRKEEAARERFAMPPPQPEAGSTGKPESNAPPAGEPFPATSGDGGAAANALAENRLKPASPAPAGARRDEAARDAYAQAQKPEESARARAAGPSQQTRALAAPAPVAKVSVLDEVKAKQAGADSVEAWIARIRELKANGRLDETTKELAKFRAAYGERADALLPPDLRRP